MPPTSSTSPTNAATSVPVTLICPQFAPAQAKEWIHAGEIPVLAKAGHRDYLDIDSGHWPKYTQPTKLAQLLAHCADR